ncbi:MAG: hypothetical protein RLY20_2270 [Verrucomicrobiota bacterium]|jgi:hypothetical protein
MNSNKSAPASGAGVSRRQFIYTTALAAGGLTLAGYAHAAQPRKLSANDKLNIAFVGASGKGASDTDCCNTENVVALCDVDEVKCAGQRAKYPNAKFYRDWRELLDKEKNIDAVVVSTPDHMHAMVASAAIKLGKHVYCQKPLTQTVYEARYLRDLAAKYKVVTQMGNQGSAHDGLRRAVEVIQAGVIGPVRQVHVWTNRPIWPQGIVRPAGSDIVPGTLSWDNWLGPAAERPYKKDVYHAWNWRGWFDFGTGALGDMACHTANMPFRALKLGYPTSVELLEHSELFAETYPKASKIKFVFPARDTMPAVDFFWYDGNPKDKSARPYRPDADLTKDIAELMGEMPIAGCLLIGDKGQLFSPDDYGARFFIKLNDEKEYSEANSRDDVKVVPVTIPRNPFKGEVDLRHHQEWIAGCKGGPQPYSHFGIAAYLTEIILLGCVALRAGKKLEWDGPSMKATNAPEAAKFVKRDYRKGWKLA